MINHKINHKRSNDIKYYITLDKYCGVFHASTPHQACMKAIKRKFANGTNCDMVGKNFRVSQRGFARHDDDEYISTETILKLLLLINNEVKDEIF